MFSKLIFSLALAAAVASPFINAEVPQEHSHDKLRKLNEGGIYWQYKV